MKKGFTLIEMLSVVIILAILFLFVTPKLALFIKNGGQTNQELIEEKVLNAAKEYVNDYDTSFLKSFYNVGDSKNIYKSQLLDVGLITEEELALLKDFVGIKVELQNNDKMRYTLSYIDNPQGSYANDELYSMIEEIGERMYPVGSIYISVNNTNPSTLFGGTWVSYGEGRTLVGAGTGTDSRSESKTFAVNSTGGEYNHLLTVAEMPSHNHMSYVASDSGNYQLTDNMIYFNSGAWTWHDPNTAAISVMSTYSNALKGNSTSHNNIQPYITVYMWKRTA